MKKTFDIVLFNLNNYLSIPYVSKIYFNNLKVFEEYQEKNSSKIEFKWHIIDNEKLREIAENFDLKTTKRFLQKGINFTDEIKIFLATQYENYLSFPIDLYISNPKILDKLFKNDKNLICFNRNKIHSTKFDIQINGFLKCQKKNSEFINRTLDFFEKNFNNIKYSLEFVSDTLKINPLEENVKEDKNFLDFEYLEPNYFYIPYSKIKKIYEYFKSNGIDWVYFSRNFVDFEIERKVGLTLKVLKFEKIFKEELKNNNYFFNYKTFFINESVIENYDGYDENFFIDLLKSVTGDESKIIIDNPAESFLAKVKDYCKRIYDIYGHKYNLQAVINSNKNFNTDGIKEALKDYCYVNEENPGEFIPLPYLDINDAVHQLCW